MVKHVYVALLVLLMAISFLSGTLVSTASAGSLTVKGGFTFYGEPVRHAFVELKDSDFWLSPDDVVATGYTDENGNYEFKNVPNDDVSGGIDAYVVCYAYNWAANVMHNPDWMIDELPWVEAGTCNFKTDTIDDLKDGTIWDFGRIEAPKEVRDAFNVFDTVLIGYDFMNFWGYTPRQIEVFWDDSWTPGSSYYMPWSAANRYSLSDWWNILIAGIPIVGLPAVGVHIAYDEIMKSLRGIHIDGEDGMNDRTILHEYGHFLMDHYADFWPPDIAFLSRPSYTEAFNPEHAWGEGWAHFFSAAARKWAGYSYSDYATGERDVESNELGDNVNAAIAGVLWDMHDGMDEPGDEMHIPFSYFMNVLVNYDPDPSSTWHWNDDGKDHPWNIYDFFWGFCDKYPDKLGAEITKVYNIYKLHGITVPGVLPPPVVEITPKQRIIDLAAGSAVTYQVQVTNQGSKTDTYVLSVSGLDLFNTECVKQVTVKPGQTETATLSVSYREPTTLRVMNFDVLAKSTTSPYLGESDGSSLVSDLSLTPPEKLEGGLGMSVRPREIEPIYFGDTTAVFVQHYSINIINNQNFDDMVTLRIDLRGIPTEYRADPKWFVDYADYLEYRNDPQFVKADIFIPAKSSFTYILVGKIPFFFGDRVFKVVATSELSQSSAQDAALIVGAETPV